MDAIDDSMSVLHRHSNSKEVVQSLILLSSDLFSGGEVEASDVEEIPDHPSFDVDVQL